MKLSTFLFLAAALTFSLAGYGNEQKEAVSEPTATVQTTEENGPREVALAYTKASIEGTSVAAFVEPSTENKEAIDATIKAAAEQLKAAGVTIKEYKAASVEENGDEATVQISSTFTVNGQEQTSTSPLKMKKIDGKWYLAASNFEALQQMLQAQEAEE